MIAVCLFDVTPHLWGIVEQGCNDQGFGGIDRLFDGGMGLGTILLIVLLVMLLR